MSRYFYYLIVLELVGSVISITPSFLFDSSQKGALISILLALLIGSIFVYLITAFFNQFPGAGFPELLQQYTPKWISSPVLILFGLVCFIVGLKTSWFTLFVWVISLIIVADISEPQFLSYSSYLYNGIPLFFLFFLIICWFISWRDKHAGAANT